MARASQQANQEVDMDMTPMIDCVFLLMIFFVLVIDLSQQDLEDLILPEAKYAVPDENPPDVRPIINIAQDGRMIFKNNPYYNPAEHGATDKQAEPHIRRLLLEWKDKYVKDKTVENLGGRKVTVINDPVLVRADKWTEWHYVGLFMTICSQQTDAAFWKLELAMSEEDKEVKLFGGKR